MSLKSGLTSVAPETVLFGVSLAFLFDAGG